MSNTKVAKSKKKRSKILTNFILAIPIALIFWIILVFIVNFSNADWKIIDGVNYFMPSKIHFLYLLIMIIVIYIGLMFLSRERKNDEFKFLERSDDKTYGNAEFLIDERNNVTNSQIKEMDEVYPNRIKTPSWVVNVKKVNKKGISKLMLKINTLSLVEDQGFNQLVIGSVGSGKGQKIVLNTIMFNANSEDLKKTNTQPSFVVTDPKGEIYTQLKPLLIANGYDVKALNLRNPLKSDSYNFLGLAYDFLDNSIHFEEKFKVSNPTLEQYESSNCFSHIQKKCKKCAKVPCLLDSLNSLIIKADQWDNYVKQKKIEFKELAEEQVDEFCVGILKTIPGQNAIFMDSGRGIIKATILMLMEMKEDDPSIFGKEHFNVPTILSLIADQKKLQKTFLQYGRAHTERTSWQVGASIFQSTDSLLQNFFSQAKQAITPFENSSLRRLLCENSIDFNKMASLEKPMALFLIIPDDKSNKDMFATIFISQLYRSLTYQASLLVEKKGKDELDRFVIFMLDEFANIPAINDFNKIISVSRGRHIFFSLIIQDMQQLREKYKDSEEIIKTNAPTFVYLRTTNDDTLKYVSNKVGTFTAEVKRKNHADQQERESSSIQATPLLSPGQIQDLSNEDLTIIMNKTATPKASLIKIFPFYKIIQEDPNYFGIPVQLPLEVGKPMDFENEHFFDLYKYMNIGDEVYEEQNKGKNKQNFSNNNNNNNNRSNKKTKTDEKLKFLVNAVCETFGIGVDDINLEMLNNFVSKEENSLTDERYEPASKLLEYLNLHPDKTYKGSIKKDFL